MGNKQVAVHLHSWQASFGIPDATTEFSQEVDSCKLFPPTGITESRLNGYSRCAWNFEALKITFDERLDMLRIGGTRRRVDISQSQNRSLLYVGTFESWGLARRLHVSGLLG